MEAVARRSASAARRSAARRPAPAPSSGRSAGSSRPPTRSSAAILEDAVAGLRRSADLVNGGFGGAPKFPPPSALELLLARGRRGDRRADPRRDGRGRHLRPARRRLLPLLGGRRLAGPPLREDALRQRPARPLLPARLAGARARALPPGLHRDPRLGAAGDARPRGRLLLGARCRLRGRGGALLRLVAVEIDELLGDAPMR